MACLGFSSILGFPRCRFLAVGLLLLAAGCNKPSADRASEQQDQAAPEGAVTVTAVAPQRQALRRVSEQPGFIEAFEETPLVAKIAGHVQKMYCDVGDRVRGPRFDEKGNQVEPGQVLAELWVPEIEEECRQKQALVAQAKAEVEQAQGALGAAEANVATMQAMVLEAQAARARVLANYERWQSEYKRIENLVLGQVIDQQTRDETRHQFKAAEAAREEVEAKIRSAQTTARESEAKRDKARADLAVARARVLVADAEEGRLRALLLYAKIRAPFDGVVTRRNIHTGYFLQPATGSGGQPLFVVARTDPLRVIVDMPEAEALLVRTGQPARIHLQVIKDQEFEGKVSRTAWSLDSKSRTLHTEIDLPNPEGLLRPGMYAFVRFTSELPDRLTLPVAAVAAEGEQAFCFQVLADKLVRTPIKLGQRNATHVEVLRKQGKPTQAGREGGWEDFSGREVIALGNLARLIDGQAVRPRRIENEE